MVDSDEEYDLSCREKQNRNKFRGERQGDGNYSSRSREHRRSRDWAHSDRTGSHYSNRSAEREDYSSRRAKRHREQDDETYESRKKGPRSPPDSPKRQKLSDEIPIEDHHPGNVTFARPAPHINPNFYGSMVFPGFSNPHHRFNAPPFQFHPAQHWPRPELANRLLNFKAYMATQEDDITDEDAQKKYALYKEGFIRAQVQEFFRDHESEEWFRQRYHPSEMAKVQLEKTEAVKERLAIFMQYKETIGIDELILDGSESVKLTKFLDRIVILLEGGSVEEILDSAETKSVGDPNKETVDSSEAKKAILMEKDVETSKSETNRNLEGVKNDDTNVTIIAQIIAKPEEEQAVAETVAPITEDCSVIGGEIEQAHPEEELVTLDEMNHKSSGEITENSVSQEEDRRMEDFTEETRTPAESPVEEQNKPEPTEPVCVPDPKLAGLPIVKPKNNLLNLNSIFIRALPPHFTKQEVEAICGQFDGFIRLALADPTAERNWLRRAWATFDSNVNLSSVVYRMNVLKPRCYSLGVMVNRKLSNRIRFGSPLSAHPRSIRTDVRLAAQLVYCLDRKHHLWEDSTSNSSDGEEVSWMLGILTSKNPLLDNVMDFLTEEASAEEDELLGNTDLNDHISDSSLRSLTQFMDRLLIYLRVVHSVDFYQRCEYVNEHCMPNRCGIMNVRGTAENGQPPPQELETYCKETVNAITKVFLDPPPEVSQSELLKLGFKEKDVEVEKFIETVTRKISDEKLQCEVCTKKFKSLLFVRKHIYNKHTEKLDEVASTVEFFNNYIRDAKRPKQWDGTSLAKDKTGRRDLMSMYNPMSNPRGFNGRGYFRPGAAGFGPYGPYPIPGMPQRGGRYGNYRYSSPAVGVVDHYGRPIITYRDLDAPGPDDDTFI